MSTSQSPRRRSIVRKTLAVVVGATALSLAAPATAMATPPPAPAPTIPGLPGVPVPDFVKPLLPPVKTAPAKPAQPAKPKQPAKPAPAPADPAPPVASKTGWVGLANDATHTMTIWHDGKVTRKDLPISMGSNAHPTPNGTYFTKEKYRDMYMDSSTFGVPVNSPGGYRTYVEYAVRMSWDGIFTHAAPWSVEQQGKTDVSHGCINLNTDNAKYIYENFPEGTPIVVQGTVGGQYVPGS